MRLEWDGKEDNFTFLDSGDLRSTIEGNVQVQRGIKEQLGSGGRSWAGGLSYDQTLKALTVGDESLVAQSDALLARLEDKLPQTRKYQKINHYTGVRVNVPAAIAGLPKSMRKRKKLERDDAPVTIFVDLASSAMISADDILRRGIAILAFARCLVQHRPVELWAGVALGEGGWRRSSGMWSSTLAWRIDTAPLDLSRAAFLLAHTAASRTVGYGMAPALGGHTSWDGSWPWGNQSEHVKTQTDRMRNAMGAAEMLVVPPIYGHDPLVRDPEGWITRELARLTGTGPEVGSEEWNARKDDGR